MLPRNHPDRIQITFDDRRLVANAGLLLPATLARHLGLPELVRQRLDLGDAPGRVNTSDKMMTLVASALAGGDCPPLENGAAWRFPARLSSATCLRNSSLAAVNCATCPCNCVTSPISSSRSEGGKPLASHIAKV